MTSVPALTGFTPTFVNGAKNNTKALVIDGYHSARTSLTGMSNLSNFTLSFWLYMDSSVTPTTTWSDIFTWGMTLDTTAGTCRFEQYKNTKGNYSFYYFNPSSVSAAYSNSTLAKDKWSHFVLVQDNETAKLYCNNSLIKTVTFATPGTVPRFTNGFVFGQGTNNIGARIQDFRLYDTVFTPTEINKLFRFYDARKIIANNKQLDLWISVNGSVLDDGVHKCTLTPTSVTYAANKTGSNAVFNGSSSKITTNLEWNPTKGYTIAAWCKLTSASNTGVIARNSTKYSPTIDFCGGENGAIRVFHWIDDTNTSNMLNYTIATPTAWHYYVGLWDGTTIQLWVDGTLVAQTSENRTPYNTGVVEIGNNTTVGLPLYGILADIRLYNYGLSPSEVKKISMGQVAHYLCNGKAMDTTLKKEYNGLRGSRGAGTVNVTNETISFEGSPRYQHCYDFSSSAKYVNLTSSWASLKDEKTYLMWVYSSNYTSSWSSTGQCGLLSSVESGGDGYITNGSGSSRKIRCYSYNLGSCDMAASGITAGWHLFAHVQDGFQSKTYIDGVLKASGTAKASKTALSTKANNLFLGAECAGSGISAAYFKGRVSEVRVFCKALTADEILEFYKQGHIPT